MRLNESLKLKQGLRDIPPALSDHRRMGPLTQPPLHGCVREGQAPVYITQLVNSRAAGRQSHTFDTTSEILSRAPQPLEQNSEPSVTVSPWGETQSFR